MVSEPRGRRPRGGRVEKPETQNPTGPGRGRLRDLENRLARCVCPRWAWLMPVTKRSPMGSGFRVFMTCLASVGKRSLRFRRICLNQRMCSKNGTGNGQCKMIDQRVLPGDLAYG